MRLFALVLLSSTVFCAVANAQECSTTVYGRVASGYVYKDFDDEASAEGVTQGGITRSCGPWSFDTWASYGPAGGLANEVDFSVFYDTEAGPFRVQLAAQYFLVNLEGDSLLDARDDMAEVYADVSYPMEIGNLTIAPLFRAAHVIGVDDLPSQTLVQPGVRVTYRLSDRLSASADLRESVNLTFDHSAFRYDTALAWQASDRTTVRFGFEGAEHTRSVFSVGVSHRY